jgi:hypothetical protein
MPRYTQARLAYALEVFRDSLPYRTKRGFKTENLEHQLRKYELRTPTSKTIAQRSSLWVDKDDSGDYDPSRSKKRQTDLCPPRPRNNKRKERELGDDREKGESFKKKGRTWKSGRNNGEVCKIVLKLTFDEGRRKLQKLADAGVPAPEAETLCDMEDEQPSLWSLGGGSFRQTSRSTLSTAARRRSILAPDLGQDDDKRSQQSCGVGLRTRMLPISKASRGAQTCTRCVPCQQTKRKCTQKKSDVGTSCTQCRNDGSECSFASSEVEQEKFKSSPGTQYDNPITIESPSSVCLDTKWITTSFVHPINFKFSAAQDPTRTCDFCRDYRHGIVGCGPSKLIEVIVERGKIVEEMGHGYRAEGKEPTNMCIMCALGRFQICRCTKHEIVPIAGLCPGDFDYRQAFDNFSMVGAPAFNHWCNFCVSPAFFACGTPQQCDKFGRPVAPGAKTEKGCGLFLCPACTGAYGQFGMDRTKLEQEVRSRGIWKVRADMEFLFHGSDLHKAYCPSGDSD